MTGKVIAAVNRKGGVGKTTMVIALADTIVSEFKSSVVIVDCDPQASASIALLGAEDTLERSKSGVSLAGAIRARLVVPDATLDRFIVEQTNRIRGRSHISLALVSNGEELWDFEFELAAEGALVEAKAAMRQLLFELRQKFAYVIVDCPPGQTHTSSAALAEADIILSPTVPDRLSDWGLDGLQRYINSHLDGGAKKAYFVATRYRARLNEHQEHFEKLSVRGEGQIGLLRREVELVALNDAPRSIGTFIDEDKRFVERLGLKAPKTFAQLYGRKASVQLIELAKAVRRELS